MAKLPWYYKDIVWSKDFAGITCKLSRIWVIWQKIKMKSKKMDRAMAKRAWRLRVLKGDTRLENIYRILRKKK